MYDSDEKKGSVASLVQGSFSFGSSRLSSRDIVASFDEVMEVVGSVLAFEPDAVFQVIKFGTNTLRVAARVEVELCQSLMELIDDLAKGARPVEDVSALSDAHSALLTMSGALAAKGVVGTNELTRYNSATTRAMRSLGRAVKLVHKPRGSASAIRDIVRPRDEARSGALSKLKELKQQHDTLLERIDQILAAMEGFISAGVGTKIGSRQIERATDEMRRAYEELAPLSPRARVSLARNSLLTVLANRSVVNAISSMPSPLADRIAQPNVVSPTYRASAAGTGTAPFVEGTVSSPWKLGPIDGRYLVAQVNGSPIAVDLFPGTDSANPGVVAAQLDGTVAGPFQISPDVDVPWPLITRAVNAVTGYNIVLGQDKLHLVVDGYTYEISLTTGANVTPVQIAADINGSPAPVVASVEAEGANSRVRITYDNATVTDKYGERHMRVAPGPGAETQLGPWRVLVNGVPTFAVETEGWDGNDKLWIKANDDPSYVEVTLPTGTWPGYYVPASGVGSVQEAIDSAGGSDFTATVASDRISIVSELRGEGSIITLLSEGLRTSGSRSGMGYPSFNALSTLGFVDGQEDRAKDVEPQVILNRIRSSVGFNAAIQAEVPKDVLLEAVQAARGSDTTLVVPIASDPTSDWPSAARLKLVIGAGDNRGVYELTSYSWVGGSLTVGLDRRLRNASSTLRYSVIIYHEPLVLTHRVSDKNSTLQIQDTAPPSARTGLGLSNSLLRGTVDSLLIEKKDPILGWAPYDMEPIHIRVGDVVLDQYRIRFATIDSVDSDDVGLLGLDQEISPLTSMASFFVVSGSSLAYEEFISSLESWWSMFTHKTLDQLDRAMAPLLQGEPTNHAIDPVYNDLSALVDELELGLILLIDNFEVRSVPKVSELAQLLSERGFDRLRDLLMGARFSDLFSATYRTSTYTGAFLTAAAEVVVEDANKRMGSGAPNSTIQFRHKADWLSDRNPGLDFTRSEGELPEVEFPEEWPDFKENVG